MPQNRLTIPNSLTVSDAKQCRYWFPTSQPFAGGDQLLRYLYAGWIPEGTIRKEFHWHSEGRHTVIYYFHLSRDGRRIVMPVMSNPFVEQIICNAQEELNLKVVEVEIGDHTPAAISRIRARITRRETAHTGK